jgi:regulation of enolase protein 1 (concanavalin A-like superfamily)
MVFEGFTNVDLGSPGFEGKTFIMEPKSERRVLVEGEGGPIIVTGSGHDIWRHNDAGHFLSQPWSGDVDVIVHVSAFNDIYNAYAKAGIMLRADNSHDATHVFGSLSGTKGAIMTTRKAKAKYATHGGNYYVTNPVQKSSWIRLTKIGEWVQCFFKNNEDEEWMLKGAESVAHQHFANRGQEPKKPMTSSSSHVAKQQNQSAAHKHFAKKPPSSKAEAIDPAKRDQALAIGRQILLLDYEDNRDNEVEFRDINKDGNKSTCLESCPPTTAGVPRDRGDRPFRPP